MVSIKHQNINAFDTKHNHFSLMYQLYSTDLREVIYITRKKYILLVIYYIIFTSAGNASERKNIYLASERKIFILLHFRYILFCENILFCEEMFTAENNIFAK